MEIWSYEKAADRLKAELLWKCLSDCFVQLSQVL